MFRCARFRGVVIVGLLVAVLGGCGGGDEETTGGGSPGGDETIFTETVGSAPPDPCEMGSLNSDALVYVFVSFCANAAGDHVELSSGSSLQRYVVSTPEDVETTCGSSACRLEKGETVELDGPGAIEFSVVVSPDVYLQETASVAVQRLLLRARNPAAFQGQAAACVAGVGDLVDHSETPAEGATVAQHVGALLGGTAECKTLFTAVKQASSEPVPPSEALLQEGKASLKTAGIDLLSDAGRLVLKISPRG